jgi:hypothetical protein
MVTDLSFKYLIVDAKNRANQRSSLRNRGYAIILQITTDALKCVVLTSVNEPEMTEESRCVTGSPFGVEFEDKPWSRAVQHVGNVCEPPTEKS